MADEEEDQTEGFKEWLPKLIRQFDRLTSEEQTITLEELIEHCGSEQKWHLQQRLPDFLYRDFISLLPTELMEKILDYLDCQTLLAASCVSRVWNERISHMTSIWQNQANRLGTLPPQTHAMLAAKDWKRIAQYGHQTRRRIKTSEAFVQKPILDLIRSPGQFCALSHDKGFIAAAAVDSNRNDGLETVVIWSPHRNSVHHSFLVPRLISVIRLVYPELLVCGHFDGSLTIWDLAKKVDGPINHYRGHTAAVLACDVSQSLDLVVTGSADFTVKLWSLTSPSGQLKSIGGFTHWVVSVILRDSSNHSMVKYAGHNILLSMTRDNVRLFAWRKEEEIDTEAKWTTPLKGQDGYDQLREVFFTPGMHFNRDTVTFIRQMPMFDTHTIGDSDIVVCDAATGEILNTVHVNQKVRKLVAVGRRYALLLLPYVDSGYKNLAIVDLVEKTLIGGCTVPHSRATTPDFAQVTTGSMSWLDGLSEDRTKGLVVGLAINDAMLHLVSWEDPKKKK